MRMKQMAATSVISQKPNDILKLLLYSNAVTCSYNRPYAKLELARFGLFLRDCRLRPRNGAQSAPIDSPKERDEIGTY
jgi:hypothetical protein